MHCNHEYSCRLICCIIDLHSRRRARWRWAMAFWSTSCVYRPRAPHRRSDPRLAKITRKILISETASHRHVSWPSTYDYNMHISSRSGPRQRVSRGRERETERARRCGCADRTSVCVCARAGVCVWSSGSCIDPPW